MRIAWLTGSEYEWAQHWRVARGVGLADADLVGVRDWQAHASFGPSERAVLAATDEVVGEGAISTRTWQACVRHLGDDPHVLLELVAALGAWRMIASLLHSLDVPLEDGVASWPPDNLRPRHATPTSTNEDRF